MVELFLGVIYGFYFYRTTYKFWKITNQIMNRNEAAVFTITNGPEIISSSADKANNFASIFA